MSKPLAGADLTAGCAARPRRGPTYSSPPWPAPSTARARPCCRCPRVAGVAAVLAALRPDEPLERDDVALVVPTSGSTGEPKGALLTAAALRHSARATHDRLGGPGQWLLALPVTHVAGLQVLVRSLVGRPRPGVLDLYGGFSVDGVRGRDGAARAGTAALHRAGADPAAPAARRRARPLDVRRHAGRRGGAAPSFAAPRRPGSA